MVERPRHAPDLIVRINGEIGKRQVAARDLLCSIADAKNRLCRHRGEEVGKDTCRYNKDNAECDDGQCRANAQGGHIVMRRLRDDDPARRRILRVAHIVFTAVNIDIDDAGLACQRFLDEGIARDIRAVFFLLNLALRMGENLALAVDDDDLGVIVRFRLDEIL